MPVVRFYLNDDAYKELEKKAEEEHMTIQDYVRMRCISPREDELTVADVVQQINAQRPEGEFKISDLFTEEKWSSVSIGIRAYLGKSFYEKVSANEIPDVEFVGMKKRIACYRLKKL